MTKLPEGEPIPKIETNEAKTTAPAQSVDSGKIEKKGKIYLGWIPKEMVEQMQEKVPGLYEKLSALTTGEVPNLTEQEKGFFVEAIMSNTPEISNVITGIAAMIWGAHGAHWQDPQSRKYRQENIAASFWWDFCSSSLERGRVRNLVDFYLGTTKAEAEAQASARKGYAVKLK